MAKISVWELKKKLKQNPEQWLLLKENLEQVKKENPKLDLTKSCNDFSTITNEGARKRDRESSPSKNHSDDDVCKKIRFEQDQNQAQDDVHYGLSVGENFQPLFPENIPNAQEPQCKDLLLEHSAHENYLFSNAINNLLGENEEDQERSKISDYSDKTQKDRTVDYVFAHLFDDYV